MHIYTFAHTHRQQENDASMYCTRFMLSFLLFWPYKCEHTHTDTYTLTGEWDHTVKAFAFFWLFHFDSNYIVVPVLVALSQQFLAGACVSVFVFASVCVCTCDANWKWKIFATIWHKYSRTCAASFWNTFKLKPYFTSLWNEQGINQRCETGFKRVGWTLAQHGFILYVPIDSIIFVVDGSFIVSSLI